VHRLQGDDWRIDFIRIGVGYARAYFGGFPVVLCMGRGFRLCLPLSRARVYSLRNRRLPSSETRKLALLRDKPAQHRPVGDRVAAHALAVPPPRPDAQPCFRVQWWNRSSGAQERRSARELS